MVDTQSLVQSLETLVDRMPVGIAMFSPELTLIRCNPVWAGFVEQYTGLPAGQVMPGVNLFDLLPDARSALTPIIQQVLAGETVQHKAFPLGQKNRQSYWDMVFAPYTDDEGVAGIINLATDVTEQVLAEDRRRVAESLRDILTILNSNRPLDEILDYIVVQACRLLGSDAAAIYRCHYDRDVLTVQAAAGLPPDYTSLEIPMALSLATQAMQSVRPVVVPDAEDYPEHPLDEITLTPEQHAILEKIAHRYRAVLAVPLIIRTHPAAPADIYGGITLHYVQPRQFSQEEIDLAVAFADQAALAIENARLRAQAEQSAAEAERNRLARDLHDAVTQTLFSASLIAEVLPRLWDRHPDEARRRLEELRQLTRGALAEMRTLLLELRPAALEAASLPDLLRHLTDAIIGRGRMPVRLTISGEATPPTEVKTAFYRIAQEALNNIVKHAGSTEVQIDLHLHPDRLRMVIRDRGPGFDIRTVPPEHFGLQIMQERAEAAAAKLTIHSRPGQGTRIEVSWTPPEVAQ
ncbi:MAG: GAF domain-containing protein [Chloroflexi bacterium]|nr:MAG: GAF domain-containing protein [Chloroflexota bacterium]